MTDRTRQDIEAEADELASEVLTYEPHMTVETAHSRVYEEVPEHYDEYRTAPATLPPQPISKSVREPTPGRGHPRSSQETDFASRMDRMATQDHRRPRMGCVEFT